MNYNQILKKLKAHASKKNAAGMARVGIRPKTKVLGVSIRDVRKIAKEIGKDHKLAQELWKTKVHEARHLANIIDEPEKVTEAQMGRWVKEFDSWDLVDQCCSNLFDKTPFAYTKIREWSKRDEEFIKRAGLVLIATLSVHDKEAPDSTFEKIFPILKREATDERNVVKKAVNWALRQIGKRNLALNKKAIKTAREIQKIDNKTAKWIANDALRELESEVVQKRLKQTT